jgi:hypothetical protein
VTDLRIAMRCGWRYEWVADLDPDVYDVLIDELTTEHQEP